MRKAFLGAAAILAAAVVFLVATLPDPPTQARGAVDTALLERTVPGAYHVHSRVSDGAGTREEIAAAAARAGLRFVVFTDHGDGTRAPEPPRYVERVLCIDAVEISTNGGHYVALDMRPAAYPLGGEAAAVVEDVRRLGGFGIAAHPYSPRAELAWRDWSPPIDGLEWLNADSEWRDERAPALLRLPFDALLRPGPAMASILDRPETALVRWDALTAARPIVALAAHDAHGSLGGGREGESRFGLPGFPSYEKVFRAFALRAIVERPLSGQPSPDARLLLDALRRGRVFSAIDGAASPAYLEFNAATPLARAQMGDAMVFEPGVELIARATLPEGGEIVLHCDGGEVLRSSSGELRRSPAAPATCRPEVLAPHAPGRPPVPWIVGNPIYLLSAIAEPVGAEPLFESVLTLERADWGVEKEAGSEGSLERQNGGVLVRYRLRGGDRVSQFAAVAAPLPAPLPPFDRLLFTADASGPMRVSLQLRLPDGRRWAHSVYVEPDPRRAVVPVSAFVPADEGPADRPDLTQASSILFVVDLTNAAPGAAGWFRIADVTFARALPAR